MTKLVDILEDDSVSALPITSAGNGADGEAMREVAEEATVVMVMEADLVRAFPIMWVGNAVDGETKGDTTLVDAWEVVCPTELLLMFCEAVGLVGEDRCRGP